MNKFPKRIAWLQVFIAVALVLTLLPTGSAQASIKTNAAYGVTLHFPDSSTHCNRWGKFFSTGMPDGWTVTYTFNTASHTGLGALISETTVNGGEFVVFEYPGGVGNGMYAVTATYRDVSGTIKFRLAGKWTMVCEKAK